MTDRNPLKPMAWLKITLENGDELVKGYGSNAEAFEAEGLFWGARNVVGVEIFDKNPDSWKSVGEVTKGIIEKCSTTKK